MPQLKGKTVLLIGAGPTRIGQGGECDQGAVEACDTLKSMGCRVIAVDANPDAVLTDKGVAHQRYVEPLTIETIRQIITAEKPDALLTIFAGRSGLHLAGQLADASSATPTVPLWGTAVQSLKQVQDRDGLKSALSAVQLKTLTIFSTSDLEAASAKAQQLGFPVVLRCDDADTMADGVLVYNQEELSAKATAMSTESETVLSVEESLWQWRQVELELLRDGLGHTVIAGLVDYMDGAGIHPGDAIGVTPAQTISPELQRELTKHAQIIADHLNIIGNATLRFAYDPQRDTILTTAVHPRFTRTSAFVSQTSGIPIASIATLLAAGLTWQQLPKALTNAMVPQDGPTAVAVKWPVWDFERMGDVPDRLGPQMQAVGQSLGIGLTFGDAFQKAMRGANPGIPGLGWTTESSSPTLAERVHGLAAPSSRRAFVLYEALMQEEKVATLAEQAHIAPWFIQQMAALVSVEKQLHRYKGQLPPDDLLRQAKIEGFADRDLARILSIPVDTICQRRSQIDLQPRWRALLRADAKNSALHLNPYGHDAPKANVKAEQNTPVVLMIGSGPTRIGLGSECDHALFQAVQATRAAGFKPVILNCNLTGVTMGRAMAGKADVLVGALDQESIESVIQQFKPMGVITQFAGNRPLDEYLNLKPLGMLLLGGGQAALKILSHRSSLWHHIRGLGIPLPAAETATSNSEVLQKAADIGFPILVRPAVSRAAEAPQLIQSTEMLTEFLAGTEICAEYPLFMERLLEYAIEAQAEVLSDGESAMVAAVLEQIELAGVHAGDSACVLPPYSIGPRHVETITEYATKVALSLKAKGVLNLRFAVYRDSVYCLDVSCRECRNWSMVTKATQIPLAELATRIQLGQALKDISLVPAKTARFNVRVSVFPFNVFSETDPLLGPSMRSTGEALAMADSFGIAYFKALEATDTPLPTQGGVLITVTDEDKPSILEPARIFSEQGFNLLATRGTQAFLSDHGLPAETVRKLGFGRPNLVDEMKNGRVQMVINTPTGDQGRKDGSYIRKAAIHRRIANINTPAGAVAAAKGIAARKQGAARVGALEG